MKTDKKTTFISCSHSMIYLESVAGNKQSKCTKCKMVKIQLPNWNKVLENPPLTDLLGVRKEVLSMRTSLSRRRIYFKTKYQTEYTAKKQCINVAIKCLEANPNWQDVFVEIPFVDGYVQALIDRNYFDKLNVGSLYSWEPNGLSKENLEKLTKKFTISRLSRFVPPGSKFESILATITKNKRFV